MSKIDRIFYGYSVVAGLIFSVLLVRWPQAADFTIKPFFWLLGAVAFFDLANFAINRAEPGTMISTQTRLIGLLIGVAMVATASWWFAIPLRLF